MFRRLLQPASLLRLGLGVMYLYSGLDIIKNPTAWYWAVRQLPDVIEKIPNAIGVDRFLTGHGVGELVFAAVLLIPFVPRRAVKFVALLSAVEMAAILLMVGVDGVTFRDIGLLGAALALFRIL